MEKVQKELDATDEGTDEFKEKEKAAQTAKIVNK